MSTSDSATEPTVEARQPRLLAQVFTPSLIVVTALAGVLTIVSIVVAAGDAHGDELWAGIYIWASAIPTAWSVLQLLWRRDPYLPAIFAAFRNTLVVPLIVAPIFAVLAAVVVHLPAVTQLITQSRSANGWHYYFSERDGSLLQQTLVLSGFVDIGIGMLTGLALSVFVILQVEAFRRPDELARSNMLDPSAENASANRTAIRVLAVTVMLIFVVPTLIVVGSKEAVASSIPELFTTLPFVLGDFERYWGDALWALGLALVPVGIAAVVIVRLVQRPDRARRAAAGMTAGVDVLIELGSSLNEPAPRPRQRSRLRARPEPRPRPE